MTQETEWNLYLLEQLVKSGDETGIEKVRGTVKLKDLSVFEATLSNARTNVQSPADTMSAFCKAVDASKQGGANNV